VIVFIYNFIEREREREREKTKERKRKRENVCVIIRVKGKQVLSCQYVGDLLRPENDIIN